MPFRNYFSQFGNSLPDLINLSPILLQIPRISQPLKPNLPTYALIGNITVRENCRWTDQAILHSKISSKLWPLAVKSPAQSLDYRANSYHIHLNTLGFHGCSKEISQICPCPFCPINTSFSATLSPSCYSTASSPLSRRRHCLRTPRTPARASPTNLPSLQSPSSSGRNGHQLHRSWGQPIILLLYFYCTPVHLQIWLLSTFSSFSILSSSISLGVGW